MEHGDGSQMGGTSREGCLEPPAEDIFMIVTKMEIQVVRIIARLLTSLSMAMAKESTWLIKGSEQETETIADCSQRKLFMMLDPQKDNSRRKQVSVREETTPHM